MSTPVIRAVCYDAGDSVGCGDVPTGGAVALTVELWARADTLGSGNRPLVAKYGADGHDWALYTTKDGRVYWVTYDASSGVSVAYTAPGTLTAGAWHHVAGCYDAVGGLMRIWIDGADATVYAVATGNAVRDTAQELRLGGYLANPDLCFVGRTGWCRVSGAVRYTTAFSVLPVVYPAVDGATLAQWNADEGTGLRLDNAVGEAAYDGIGDGISWCWMAHIGIRSLHVQPRGRGLTIFERQGAV